MRLKELMRALIGLGKLTNKFKYDVMLKEGIEIDCTYAISLYNSQDDKETGGNLSFVEDVEKLTGAYMKAIDLHDSVVKII